MAEIMVVRRNMQVLNRLFPAYRQYFGYAEPLSKEDLEQRKRKLSQWVAQISENIDQIDKYIRQSEQKTSVFLDYFHREKKTKQNSQYRAPFHKFTQNLLNSQLASHQNIGHIDRQQNRKVRQEIAQMKKALDDIKTKGVVRVAPRSTRSTSKRI